MAWFMTRSVFGRSSNKRWRPHARAGCDARRARPIQSPRRRRPARRLKGFRPPGLGSSVRPVRSDPGCRDHSAWRTLNERFRIPQIPCLFEFGSVLILLRQPGPTTSPRSSCEEDSFIIGHGIGSRRAARGRNFAALRGRIPRSPRGLTTFHPFVLHAGSWQFQCRTPRVTIRSSLTGRLTIS
jgi:hypothetical protein